MTTYHLHLGAIPKNLVAIQQVCARMVRKAAIIDGDGAEVWGEPVGANGNDPTHLHVIVPIDDTALVGPLVEALSGMDLIGTQSWGSSVLTEDTNWNEQVEVPSL